MSNMGKYPIIKSTLRLVSACFILIQLSACKSNIQDTHDKIPDVDPNIKNIVNKNISETDAPQELNAALTYQNSMYLDMYQNDKLIVASDNGASKGVFKSFYYWKNDTLIIEGLYGKEGGMGFTFEMSPKHTAVYHRVTNYGAPKFALNKTSSLQNDILVPCKATKVVLSEIPNPQDKPEIYGLVEFTSDVYYSLSETNVSERDALHADMKIYFKSNYVPMLTF
jgi:hypothetical protein